MIKLFVSDIDGCLSEPYQPFDLQRFQTLSTHIREGQLGPQQEIFPAFSLCSGRAYAYVEAIGQLLGVRIPVLFESGGGMFDPVRASVIWNPLFSKTIEFQMSELREWLIRTCLPNTSLMFDYGKRTQVGLIGPKKKDVLRTVPIVSQYVRVHYPHFRLFNTEYAIDVLAEGITKRQALHWLTEVGGFSLDETAYIGDSSGDIRALESVGFSFAPANATEDVKQSVDIVTENSTIDGVLEAYQWCVHHNSTEQKDALAPTYKRTD